jgi:DNA-binding MarR family transcriptional regulator
MSRSGADLALLMLGGYRRMVDTVLAQLDERGFADVRPVHEFAMRGIAAGADSASDLGRRMSVSKQAAAKTIATLLERGYVVRSADPADARRKRLEVTDLGWEIMRTGEQLFDAAREEFARQIGAERLAALERDLATIVGDAGVRSDTPGWIADT